MVSPRQKIAVVAVVIIIVLVGGILVGFLVGLNQPPSPSMAEKMILHPGDISGPGWQSYSGVADVPLPTNASSIYRALFSNETIELWLIIEVLNSSNDSLPEFMEYLQSLGGTQSNITLGDEACYWENGTTHSVIFARSNVIAWVHTFPYPQHEYSWQHNATITIAMLQLEKIDRYLEG
jgi:hypothetical protein